MTGATVNYSLNGITMIVSGQNNLYPGWRNFNVRISPPSGLDNPFGYWPYEMKFRYHFYSCEYVITYSMASDYITYEAGAP